MSGITTAAAQTADRVGRGLNPLDYNSDLALGITAIQAQAGSGTVDNTEPCHIYVPAGTYYPASDIIITRSHLTLTIDGGALIYVRSGGTGIKVNGPVVKTVIRSYGIIRGVDGTTELDAVYIDGVQSCDFFFNVIKWVGRDGIRFHGNNFSNKFTYNMIFGVGGWGINTLGDANQSANVYWGEIQNNALGGFNALKLFGCTIRGIIEGHASGNPALALDSSKGNEIGVHFENSSGHDISVLATYWPSRANQVVAPTVFASAKSAPYYNINLANSASVDFAVIGGEMAGIASRWLFVDAGNSGTIIGPNASIPTALSAITNNATAGQTQIISRRPASKFLSINVTTGTQYTGNLTGADYVVLMQTNNTPGNQQTRSAAQMVADHGIVLPGDAYRLRIVQTGTGTFTLTAGANVTLTGTMTIPVNTWRDFVVTFDSLTALTIQSVGTGTYS